MENHYGRLKSELIFQFNHHLMEIEHRVQYEGILINLIHTLPLTSCQIQTLVAGTYVTLFYDNHYRNNHIYYKQLVSYLKEQKLTPLSDIYEFTILPRVDQHGIEKSVIALEVLIKEE